jgi:hypothetical protein
MAQKMKENNGKKKKKKIKKGIAGNGCESTMTKGVFGRAPRSSGSKKNQLRSQNCQPNTTSSSSSTVDLLQKKWWSSPQLHGFNGVPQEVLHQIQISWS